MQKTVNLIWAVLIANLLSIGGCTPALPPPPQLPSPSFEGQTPPHRPAGYVWCETDSNWGTMPKVTKKSLMEQTIFPRMHQLFKEFDPERFGNQGSFHCQTCHGRDATSLESFTAPSVLIPLDPKKLPTRDDPDPRIARYAKFMEDVVVPEMRRLLQANVDCFSCHAKAPDLLHPPPKSLSKQKKEEALPESRLRSTREFVDIRSCEIKHPGQTNFEGRCVFLCRSGECPGGFQCVESASKKICLQPCSEKECPAGVLCETTALGKVCLPKPESP